MPDSSSKETDKQLWRTWRPWVIVSVAVLATLVLLALALVVLPPLLVPGGGLGPPAPQAVPSVRPSPSSPQPRPAATPPSYADVNNALSAARGNLVAALGVLAVLIGGAVGFLNFRESQRQSRLARDRDREQLELMRRGQVTERFSRAIEQLGDDKIDVRIGAIYSLEQIARDSPEDLHGPVMETLTAFLRGHSAPFGDSIFDIHPTEFPAENTASDENVGLRADFQATATVLGRRAVERDTQILDLRRVDLRRANLAGAHLEQANLWHAHLEEAYLAGAHLEKANLVGAHLEKARLLNAHLEEAHIVGAHLEKAQLMGAHLEKAQLVATHLVGALVDAKTTWPSDFNWRAAIRQL